MLNWPMSEKFCRRVVGEAVKIYDLWLPARNSKMHKSQNKLLTPLELRRAEKLSVPYALDDSISPVKNTLVSYARHLEILMLKN